MKKSCHCGNIIVEYPDDNAFEIARQCGCHYCSAAGPTYVSNPYVPVTFQVIDKSQQKITRQGSGTAEFHECINCGLVLVTSEIEGASYCVLNAKTLGIDVSAVDPNVRNFTGESIKDRLARRKLNWCPVCELT